MNDDVLKLYNSLQKYGYNNLGTSEEFGTKVQDSTSRRKLYDSLTRDGFNNLGTFDEFSGRLVTNQQKSAAAPRKALNVSLNPSTEQAYKETMAPKQEERPAAVDAYRQETGKEPERVNLHNTDAETVFGAEEEANPFPYSGGLEQETEEIAKLRETVAEDKAFVDEYERRKSDLGERTKGLRGMRGDTRGKFDAGQYQEDTKWLQENADRYKQAKASVEKVESVVKPTENAIASAENKIAQRKNREEMASPQEIIATGRTAFGGDNAGRQDSEHELRKYADELYASADKEYDKSSKYQEGYEGNFWEQLWTGVKDFGRDAGNNIDSGSFTFGLSKGLAGVKAREVGDKYNDVINSALKDMGMSEDSVKSILSSIEESVPKLEALEEELTAAGAEIDTMSSTYEDMVRRGDPNAESYGRQLQKKIDAYNKRINDEYKPTWDAYNDNRQAYEDVMAGIDTAIESGLTGGEKALLDALEKFTQAKTLRSDDVSVAGKAGAGAEQSAEFMLDFILTGGISKAGTKVATKIATNRALKKYGAEALKEMARVGKTVKPGLGLRLGTDVVTSLARTGVMAPRTIQAYSENLTEYNGKDETGRYEWDRSQANALANSLLTQYIEYWSEGFGEYFGEAERALFRGVTKNAPKTAIGQTLKGYRGSIGQYLDKGKFDGMFNEMLEEVVGSTFNALAGWMSGDRVGDSKAMKEFVSGENLATLALSFLPMSAIGAATNMSAYHKMRERYDKGVEGLSDYFKTGAVSPEELQQLSKDIPNLSPEEIKDKIVDITDRARKQNGGSLPSDFTQNVLGYLEGEFAMGLRYDEWEDSQEKMSVVNAYTANYANPDARAAWDLNDDEQTAKQAALDAGFTEEELDNDSYMLAQDAFEIRGTQPERSDILMNYASAKAAANGLQKGYEAETQGVNERNAQFVRSNIDTNGQVIQATLNGNTPVYITQTDATVNPDGTVSTPTGDGVVEYVDQAGNKGTAKASAFSGVVSTATGEYIESKSADYAAKRQAAFETAQNTVSPTGQARAISEKVGQSVIVTDRNGVYEPFTVERMTNGGATVVLSGDRKALQGIARAMQIDAPGGKYLEAPVTRLYPLLAKEEDGSLSTGLGETSQQEAAAPAAPAQETAPAAEQAANLGDLRDQTVPISVNGQVQNAHVIDMSDGSVMYEELDGNGDVVRTSRLSETDFARAMQEAANPTPAAEAPVSETPAAAVEETPAPEAAAPVIPVDEKTGEKIYDAPGVSVEGAIADLYATEGLTEADVDQFIAEQAAKAEAARNPERGNMSPQAWGQAKMEAARVADFWAAMQRAAEQRKAQQEAAIEEAVEEATPVETVETPTESAQEEAPEARSEEDRSKMNRRLARRLERWEKRTGIKVRVVNSIDDVTNAESKQALEEGRIITGWFVPETNEVEIFAPNIDSEAELDSTFIHEVVAHRGLRGLLGDEGYADLCDRVWSEVMTDLDKAQYAGYNRHLNAVGEAARRAAADEYIAHLSENLDFYDNRSIFEKIVDWIKRILGEELSLEEIEADARERATGATPTMTDAQLRAILSDSMKRYVETTRRGQQDTEQKRDIGANVGGAMQTGENQNGQTLFSTKSIANGAGLAVIEDIGNGNVGFATPDGRVFSAETPITAQDLAALPNSVMGYMMADAKNLGTVTPEQEARIWQAYADQLNAFLQKGVAKDGLSGVDRLMAAWQWEVQNTVYKSVAENGDAQYSYSIDITRVCKKNEAVIKAISSMQRKVGYGITPGQIMDIYLQGIEEGYQVPCPVCYVFSRYINNGIVATVAINGQHKYGDRLVDPSTLSEAEYKSRVDYWVKEMEKQEKLNKKHEKTIARAKKDCSSIIEEINDISEMATSGRLQGKDREKAIRRVKALDNRYRAAFQVVSQSSLPQWIKQFAIHKVKGEWQLWGDTFQGFPEEYALDLRLTAETIEKYPAIQRLRKGRGAAGGKEIHFASNNDLGDIPMMLGADLGGATNFYQQAASAETEKSRKDLLKKASKRFADAHRYAQQQSLRGGQRMWSWSDNIERLAPDVFVNLMQLQMLGGALQAYSKQLEGVNLVASMGGYVNGSLMGYGKGWQELSADDIAVINGQEVLSHDIKDTVTEKVAGRDVPRERLLAKAGSRVLEIDGKKVTLLFDDVVGIDPYGREENGRHLKGLFDLNGELDKAGNIIVGMNDTHVRASMADDRIFFIIPWHASGNSVHIVQQMLRYLGVDTQLKDYQDYTNVQEEKDLADTRDIDPNIIAFWEAHKNETDYPVGIEGGIPSGENGALSEDQKHYRELRNAIFLGTLEEHPKWVKEVEADAFLSQVRRKVNESVDAKEMTKGDTKFIYPYEYWDESSTYDTADVNGARYLEYSRRLGYKPKFVGKLDGKPEGDYGNFAEDKGYWKLLIDRRMYGVDGRFQDLTSTTTDRYDSRMVDPEWTEQNFTKTLVADDPGADRIADKVIEREGSVLPGGVPTANYDTDLDTAVRRYDMVSDISKTVGIKDLVKAATMFREAGERNADPQVSEGGVTMFRERTAPAPEKTQKVYKLMRLGEDGNLYPLFIDRDAQPIMLGTWYDADSPDMEFLKKMPSGVFLVDAQNGTYTSLEDYKKERGEKVTKLPGIADVEEAARNGLRWMKITETENAQRRYEGENRKYENIGINGSEGVSTFAMRPGWHAGSLPTMRQIGKGKEKNLRDDNFVWVEGEIAADKDYNEEAQRNPDKDIPTHIPTDGFYMKATNANKKASQADRVGWYVAGAFKPNRIMSDSEATAVIDQWNAEHQDAPVEYDWPRESGKVFNAETMQLEDPDRGPDGDGGGTRFREADAAAREEARQSERRDEMTHNWLANTGLRLAKQNIENGVQLSRENPGFTFRLGLPGGSLLAAGVRDQQIVMSEYDLVEDSANGYGDKHSYHPFDLDDLKDLASLINHPIAVFRDPKNPYARILLLDKKGYNLSNKSTGKHDYIAVVKSVPVVDERGRYVMDSNGRRTYENRIATIYPADKSWRNLYNQIKADSSDVSWVDNKKISSWVKGHSSNVRAYDAITQKDIANIQKSFENKQDLLREEAKNLRPSGNTMFREARPVDARNAQAGYEEEINRKVTNFLLEWQDQDIPVRIAINQVMNEVGMESLPEDCDYLTRHNLVSSRADAQMHNYKLFFFEPMMQTIGQIEDILVGGKPGFFDRLTGRRQKRVDAYNEIVDYCYAVSALERNAWMRAEKGEDRDYSGITDLMGRSKEEWQEAEDDARAMIAAFQSRVNNNDLLNEMWDRIRACTDFNLEHAYKFGLLSRAEYERLHGTESQPRMWEYYIPLRGFAEDTAEDQYNYTMFTSDMAGGDVVKKAKGRTTRADDPFATMRHISEQEIVQGLQNWAKQALYNFVLRAGNNSLLTPVEPWYVKDSDSDDWILAEPMSKDNGDKKDETLEEFETRMQEKHEKGEARRGRNGLKLGHIMGNKMHRNQHMVRLKLNGAEKMIWVNGNPILAQAINGISGWNNKVLSGIRTVNRALSQFYTTYSLKFLTKNKLRDTQFSRIAALVDEPQAYLRQLEKNWWANNGYVAFGYPMMKLVAEWESGELEKKENRTEREQMFIDFMYDGGATGYTMINSMDKIKRELERMVKNAGRGERNIPIIDWYAKGVGALNEASELLTRFTFYQTSRMMGRSRERSAYDAKESSVNFNRRGLRSGIGVSGWTSAAASTLYLFINPAIQGLDKFVRLHKSHPWRMGLVDATYFMMGFVNSLLNAMIAGASDGDGDDDEKMGPDWYWNIPEWVRRSNMIIGSPFKKLGKWGYLVLALPIEYKGFYAMGELASALVQGKYAAKDAPTIANEVVGVVAELLPVNPVEGYTPGDNPAMSIVRNMMPDIAAPIMDVATNRSFAGIPLWKENIYDEAQPLSQSAFASTPEILNKAVIKLSEVTSDMPWHVDIPSGAVRGLLKGYGGGAYTFVEDMSKLIFADEAHPRRWDNVPFVSGFTGYLEEDRRDSFNSNALQRYKELSDDVVKRIRSAAPGEDLKAADIYNHPESLPQNARVTILLNSDRYILGQMYYNGMLKAGDDVKKLRSNWNKAKKAYLEIADDKNVSDEAKDAAEKEVQRTWLEYTMSEDSLVDRLMEEEYNHARQKIANGIPYEPKETLGEKAYNLTNRK